MPATTLDRIVATIGLPTALNLLDDDSDAVPDAAAVEQVLSATDSELRMIVGRAYTAEEFEKQGEDLANLAAQIAVQHAYLRRPEWKRRGKTPWQAEYEAAVAKAKAVASGAQRLDRDASQRAYRSNAPGYVPAGETYFLDGTGDF